MMTRLRTVSFCLAILIGVGTACPAIAQAKDADNAAKAPVKRIVLFNSGVGYFEHQGKVDGNATIDLKFDVEDVNDLLKSMVLEDRDGGKISTVTYGSRDPITKTLQTFAIDLTSHPTLGQLLAQIRGERVDIDAPNKIEGIIVGVETQTQTVDERRTVEVEMLNLLTDEGLRRIALDSIGRIKLANRELDAEFRQALKLLATGHAADKKSVTLNFLGEGERNIRIGYIQEAPVWKTSYRLVLDDKDDKPFLQGWAIVENTTDADWQEVNLSLVSGRPISFQMDLYSPLYAQRPTVVPELYSSLQPQKYEQDLASREELFRKQQILEARRAAKGLSDDAAESGMARAVAGKPSDGLAPRTLSVRGGPAGGMGGGFGREASAAPAGESYSKLGIKQSVSAAEGGDVGELFKYDIADAVTLARQSSAMLPIINDAVEGKKVSIYNAAAHAKHPLNGLQLTNSSDLHLMQGPVTVFDGGVYAGDAQLPDLPPGGKRLLSYALDLDVEVAATGDAKPQHLVSARLEKGILFATYKQSRTQNYTVKNSGDAAKTVLVEHLLDGRWMLVTPKEPAEKTRDVYRFAVEAEPGKAVELKIEEEQTNRQRVAVSDIDADTIQLQFISSKEVSDEIKEALREVVRRNTALADLNRQKQQLAQEGATIKQEQDRIRPNMQTIDRNSDLYKRYVKKFTDQEDQIEELSKKLGEVEVQIEAARKSLEEYLAGLTIS